MHASSPPFIVLYRWRLHPGEEQSFIAAWSRVTELLRTQRGAIGSRLHRGSDGIWYAYAQWPNSEAREQAFALGPVDAEAKAAMRQAIAEGLSEVILECVADHFPAPNADA
jgi:heme-degrading monooxygenase HmoA